MENNKNFSNFEKDFGKRFRFAREQANISQTELAEKLGYKTPGSISNIESGKSLPAIQILAKIAAILKTDLHWLITGGDPATRAVQVLAEMDMQQIFKAVADQIDPAIDTPASVETKLQLVKAIYDLNIGAKGVLGHLIKSDSLAD
ncbi:MAG: helix-turn-helix transcriptional regulator [Phycisphaerae bacterium]|nr:helix-turn-helix transcriptional regulator [Phycisphaerae bacterium]